jgi:hypothetical protein
MNAALCLKRDEMPVKPGIREKQQLILNTGGDTNNADSGSEVYLGTTSGKPQGIDMITKEVVREIKNTGKLIKEDPGLALAAATPLAAGISTVAGGEEKKKESKMTLKEVRAERAKLEKEIAELEDSRISDFLRSVCKAGPNAVKAGTVLAVMLLIGAVLSGAVTPYVLLFGIPLGIFFMMGSSGTL